MLEVTDEKLKAKILEEFNKKNKTDTSNLKKVQDPELISKILEAQGDKKEKNFLSGAGEAVTDFFSGTKKTEFPDMKEIGEAKDTGADFKIALGLSITPNQKSQIDIILNSVPGSNVMEDKFGNPIIVMPDGESFYLNKPGASFQDFAQTTAQILQYIPGYSTIAKKYANNIIKRTIAQTAQAGAVTTAQEVAANALGAGNIGYDRIAISSGLTAVFEGILGPVGRTAIKMFRGNPNYYKLVTETLDDGTKSKKIQITSQGYKALEAAGVDIKKMSPDFAEKFFQNIAKGLDNEVSAVSGKFGIDLSTSQAKRNDEGIAALYEAAKGAFGRDAQDQALAFLRKQEIQVGVGLKELIKKFNKGELSEESLEDLGTSLSTSIQNQFKKKSDEVTTAYNAIDKDAVFNGNASNVKVLKESVKVAVKDSTGVLDSRLTPASVAASKEINKFINSFVKKKTQKKVPIKTFNDFDVLRRKLSSFIGAAKNNTDKRTAIAIKQEYDKLFDDTLDNLLFAGKEGDVVLKSNILKARKLYREKEEIFGVNVKKGPVTIDDPAGKAIQKILTDPEVTGMKTINYIYGLGTVGRKETADKIIKRLKTVFGVDDAISPRAAAIQSKDFAKLRSGMIEKMFNDSVKGGKLNTQTLVKNFDFIFNKNPDIAKALFGKGEVRLLKEFVEEVRKTLKPSDLVNPSNTAAGISRIFQRGARQLVGIIGFKLASIQGLLLGRSAFDNAKDVFEQKAAKKLIAKEFGEGQPGWLQTMNETTGTGKKLASTVATVNQVYGQTISPMGVDAPKTSKEFIEEIKPPQIDIQGIRIPGVGTIPNPFEKSVGDQSSLPTSNQDQIMTAQAPNNTGIMRNLSSTEKALLNPLEQQIAMRT
tara:strand:- start:6 stop:2630 length:2625 start_codon:yes stop_codon:yes gene_type:complete